MAETSMTLRISDVSKSFNQGLARVPDAAFDTGQGLARVPKVTLETWRAPIRAQRARAVHGAGLTRAVPHFGGGSRPYAASY